MAPDLNSLPPSPSQPSAPAPNGTGPAPLAQSRVRPSSSGTPPPRSPSMSLAAAAAINAGMHHQGSRRSSASSSRNLGSPQAGRSEMRRASVALNLNLNDPFVPSPGELQPTEHRPQNAQTVAQVAASPLRSPTAALAGDPHHHRAPSIGELHQELEQEQEAQVNRLLQMIRQQQAQIRQLQMGAGDATAPELHVDPVHDSTPTPERSSSFHIAPPIPPMAPPHVRTQSPANRRSTDLSRQSSRRSQASSTSPAIPPQPTAHPYFDQFQLGHDEAAYYQAEAHSLTRENQMLKLRIRELERQVAEISSSPPNAPATPSNLTAPPICPEQPNNSPASPEPEHD